MSQVALAPAVETPLFHVVTCETCHLDFEVTWQARNVSYCDSCRPAALKQVGVDNRNGVFRRQRQPAALSREACMLRALGLTARQIATLHAVSRPAVSYVIRRAPRQPLCPLCRLELAAVVAGITAGDTMLSEYSGDKTAQAEPGRKELQQLRDAGLTLREISAGTGLPVMLVNQLLSEMVVHSGGCRGCPSPAEIACRCHEFELPAKTGTKGPSRRLRPVCAEQSG